MVYGVRFINRKYISRNCNAKIILVFGGKGLLIIKQSVKNGKKENLPVRRLVPAPQEKQSLFFLTYSTSCSCNRKCVNITGIRRTVAGTQAHAIFCVFLFPFLGLSTVAWAWFFTAFYCPLFVFSFNCMPEFHYRKIYFKSSFCS